MGLWKQCPGLSLRMLEHRCLPWHHPYPRSPLRAVPEPGQDSEVR